jgi:hypothetical protein
MTETETLTTPGVAALAEWKRKLDAGEVEKTAPKTPWEKLREAPTLKRRIVAFCHHCMGWQEGADMPPGVRSDIRDCTAKGCPLWGARPYRRE